MNNVTRKLFLATIALTSVAYGAQQESVVSMLLKRQLGKGDHGLQQFGDQKLRPYIEKEIPQEELQISFAAYQRIKGQTIIGLTLPKEDCPQGLRPILFSTGSVDDFKNRHCAINMFSINNL